MISYNKPDYAIQYSLQIWLVTIYQIMQYKVLYRYDQLQYTRSYNTMFNTYKISYNLQYNRLYDTIYRYDQLQYTRLLYNIIFWTDKISSGLWTQKVKKKIVIVIVYCWRWKFYICLPKIFVENVEIKTICLQ